jgi:glycosyltransferase involved in cell wall biosynthesis
LPFTLARNRAAADGVDLHCLYCHHGWDPWASYEVHRWLIASRFTRVLFVDSMGLGYWSVTAKQQGLEHKGRSLGVIAAAPSELIWRERGQFLTGPEDLQRVFMERRSAKLADYVLALTPDLAAYYEAERKGTSPVITLPSVLGPATQEVLASSGVADGRGASLCFAGAHDSLYGLEPFCAALDNLRLQLPHAAARDVAVKLVGRRGRLVNGDDGGLFALMQTRRWPGPVLLDPGGDLRADLGTTLDPSAVLIAAAPAAARSTLVRAAANAGVRTLVPESSLIGFDGLTNVTGFAGSRGALAGAMRAALAELPTRLVAPSVHALEDLLPPREESLSPAATAPRETPKVSVCISYFNRPHLLEQAIESLRRQTYPNIEVVLVDDASPSTESQTYTKALGAEFAARGWQVLRNKTEMWQSASRNRAVRAATGEYVLIMDDDNVAHPEEIETLVSVAQRTGAEAIWCLQHLFEGDNYPEPVDDKQARVEFFPVGPFPSVGAVSNTSGDLNALFRRQTLLDMGGYVARTGVGCEDHVLGLEVAVRKIPWAVVARPLYSYRFSEGQMANRLNNLALYLSHRRVLDPYVNRLPTDLADVARLYNDNYFAQMVDHGGMYWSRFRGSPESYRRLSRNEQPSYASLLLHLAGNCLEQGDEDMAARYARQALESRPSDSRVQTVYLEALSRLGDSDLLGQALSHADISEELRSRYSGDAGTPLELAS